MSETITGHGAAAYHGGKMIGRDCKAFLLAGFGKHGDFTGIVTVLRAHAKELAERGDDFESARGVSGGDLIDLLEDLCQELARAVVFCLAIKPSPACVAAGVASCAAFVRKWRASLGEGNVLVQALGLGERAGVKPKYHIMEMHMAQFFREMGCLGEYSEGSVEAVHGIVNKHNTTWRAVANVQRRWQLIDDRRALSFLTRVEELRDAARTLE